MSADIPAEDVTGFEQFQVGDAVNYFGCRFTVTARTPMTHRQARTGRYTYTLQDADRPRARPVPAIADHQLSTWKES